MHRGEVERLYRTYGPAVRRRARAILGDDGAADDVMHAVFVKTVRVGDQFRGEPSPMTWMYRITTDECLALLRRRPGRAARGADLALRRVLERVAPELCEIAIYAYVDHLNHDEIAAILGLPRAVAAARVDELRAAAAEVAAAAPAGDAGDEP